MYHSFVDEAKRPYFLLVATLIRPGHFIKIRREITSMVMPRQRRIHFHNERDSRRAQIMGLLAELPFEAVIYESAQKVNEKTARDACLALLVRDHLARNVSRVVIEREESRVDADRQVIRSGLATAKADDRLAYEHLRAHEEVLLCIPDAIGWCWRRGGHWRVKAKGLVTEVFQA